MDLAFLPSTHNQSCISIISIHSLNIKRRQTNCLLVLTRVIRENNFVKQKVTKMMSGIETLRDVATNESLLELHMMNNHPHPVSPTSPTSSASNNNKARVKKACVHCQKSHLSCDLGKRDFFESVLKITRSLQSYFHELSYDFKTRRISNFNLHLERPCKRCATRNLNCEDYVARKRGRKKNKLSADSDVSSIGSSPTRIQSIQCSSGKRIFQYQTKISFR